MLPSDTSDPLQACTAWVRSRIPRATIVEDNDALEPVARELRSYLDGSTREFTFPLDPRGTPFQMSVWEALQEIPYGQVRSYASVAARIGKPRAVRAVGAANGSNPIPILIPCHRVIGSNGTLTGYGGGLGLKERLLRLEGIIL
jgi:methylated-DNA-[protein]-cysteine S-methyltransferase